MKLFPVSPIAAEERRLREKVKVHAVKGWKLNFADARALEAIEQFYSGATTEQFALAVVRSAKASNVARFRGRR